jgi:hypothetical protein
MRNVRFVRTDVEDNEDLMRDEEAEEMTDEDILARYRNLIDDGNLTGLSPRIQEVLVVARSNRVRAHS